MTARLLISLLFVFTSLGAQAERIVFDMSVFGFKFGEMVLTKTVVNDSIERYTLNAKGKTDFLWMNREEESVIKVEYRNGRLFSSDYKHLTKGELDKWSKVQLVEDRYVVKSNEGEKSFTEPLDYSLLKLYFEPVSLRSTVFCEEDCSYAKRIVSDEDQSEFQVHCQDGSRSTYHLKDGKVEAMEMHLAMATVKLTRVN